MKTINPDELVDKATIQIQYVAYNENQWTLPLKLTQEILNKVYKDLSIKKIRIKPDEEDIFYDLDVI